MGSSGPFGVKQRFLKHPLVVNCLKTVGVRGGEEGEEGGGGGAGEGGALPQPTHPPSHESDAKSALRKHFEPSDNVQ